MMEFSPFNPIVKLCLAGMKQEEQAKPEAAAELFMQAWKEASCEFEKFISAYFIAPHQTNVSDQLNWLETALQSALKIDDDTVKSALPILYSNIASCYEELGEPAKAKLTDELAASVDVKPADKGPFYHGTKADLQVGDLLTVGGHSNYQPELRMNHIYFTALVNGAGLAAALAKGNARERVYRIEPTGEFENDPNVTNKKFPGNPTRSYRSQSPLKIVAEVSDWLKQAPAEVQKWQEKVDANQGDIIN